MCNMNSALGHNSYCATGCPKCSPMGENQYGYMIDHCDEQGIPIGTEQLCVDCGFIINYENLNIFDSDVLSKKESLGIIISN